jgi:predicted metal-dependent RNase
MKFSKTQLLEPCVTEFPRLETLMIEATYGGKTNIVPSRKECEMQFAEFIKSVVARKGKILIPVLGVGRAQEVMMIVSELIRLKYMPEIPIFIEGMIWDVTAIHSAYPEFLNSDIRKLIFHKNENPFLSPLFRRVASAKERKEVLEDTGSCIVMATSGMLMGGPSVQYLKEFADSDRNMLLFVSYQAENTLGRRIQRGDREITFPTGSNKVETVPLKLEVQTLEGFTGHSDRRQLMNFIYKCTPKPKKVIINHGEASRCLDFASSIYKMYGIETVAPKNLEAVRLK